MNKVVEKPKKYSLVERTPAATFEEERLHRKQRLAATFRLFSRYGFDQGLAGHVTVRDPEFPERFWINPLSKHFSQIKVSDLQLVDHDGNILIGDKPINQAGFVIHSAIHAAHPEVIAAAHTHSTYGKAWSALGRLLDPLTQDSCAFYEDHVLFDPFSGVVLEAEEGRKIAQALGSKKAAILQNHGLLTVGPTIEAAAWWYIAMDNAARAQLLAEAAGTPKPIPHEIASLTSRQVGTHKGGYFSFQGIDGRARWHRSAVEEVLPVECLPYDDRLEIPEGFSAVIKEADHPLLKGISGKWPALLGANEVKLKKGGTLIASLPDEEGGHPLLVTGTYGKGRSLAWTSDLSPHWLPKAFSDWPGYTTLWRNALSWLAGS